MHVCAEERLQPKFFTYECDMNSFRSFATRTMLLATFFITPYVTIDATLSQSSKGAKSCVCACACQSRTCNNNCAEKQGKRSGRKRVVRSNHVCNRRRKKLRTRKAKKKLK